MKKPIVIEILDALTVAMATGAQMRDYSIGKGKVSFIIKEGEVAMTYIHQQGVVLLAPFKNTVVIKEVLSDINEEWRMWSSGVPVVISPYVEFKGTGFVVDRIVDYVSSPVYRLIGDNGAVVDMRRSSFRGLRSGVDFCESDDDIFDAMSKRDIVIVFSGSKGVEEGKFKEKLKYELDMDRLPNVNPCEYSIVQKNSKYYFFVGFDDSKGRSGILKALPVLKAQLRVLIERKELKGMRIDGSHVSVMPVEQFSSMMHSFIHYSFPAYDRMVRFRFHGLKAKYHGSK